MRTVHDTVYPKGQVDNVCSCVCDTVANHIETERFDEAPSICMNLISKSLFISIEIMFQIVYIVVQSLVKNQLHSWSMCWWVHVNCGSFCKCCTVMIKEELCDRF